jgi:uncharacterized repeat protein (TIGR01451 family)
VWDADFEAVWHLHDDLDDSTINGHAGTNQGSNDAAGQVANGQAFDGNNDWVDLGSGCYVGGAFTLEAWIRPTGPSQWDRVITLGSDECASRQASIAWTTDAGGRIEVRTATDGSQGGPNASSGSVTNGAWSHVAWSFDGSTHRLYLNGAISSGASSGNTYILDGGNELGSRDAGRFWDGDIDEPRVSTVARPGPWITATWRTTASPSSYLVLDPEETAQRALVKRAFEIDGTPIATGATVPSGKIVRFLLYIPNPALDATDVSVQDVLDPAFAYVPGSMKVDASLAASVVCPGGVCDEDAIFAQADGAGTPVGDGDAATPPLDSDVASFDDPGDTLDFGNGGNPSNAQLDVPADRVWAAVFSVRVQ